MRSHYEERYGKNFIPKDMTIQDFGVSYEELEPFFDVRGKSLRHLRAKLGPLKVSWSGEGRGGNPYAPDRSNPFPLEAQKNTVSAQLFQKAAADVGYKPYNLPSANTSGPYTNPYGAQMGRVQLLRFLQWLRVLHVLQGLAECEHPSGAASGAEFRTAAQFPRAQGQPR